MKTLILSMAALLAATSPIDQAAKGLKAEIEDDLNTAGDEPLLSIKSTSCRTVLTARKNRWVLDWRKIEEVGLGDTFIFISGPKLRLSVVGYAYKPDQAAKLKALYEAMKAEKARCGGG